MNNQVLALQKQEPEFDSSSLLRRSSNSNNCGNNKNNHRSNWSIFC